MGFDCKSVRIWIEMDVECSLCKHTFKVEYSATEKLAWEKTPKKFFKNGSYKMCPNCWELSTSWEPHLKEGDFPKYGLGFQHFCCADDSHSYHYRVFNEKGEEIARVKR